MGKEDGFDGSRARSFRATLPKDGEYTSGRHRMLTTARAEELQRGMNIQKRFFGLPLTDAIDRGYQVSELGFFETAHSPSVVTTTKTIKRLLDGQNYDGEQKVLDLFTGTGHYVWGFAQEGFTVDAVEKDLHTHTHAQNNIAKAGHADKVNIVNSDAATFIEEAVAKGKRYAAVFLDPPWSGNYTHDPSKPFRLSHTDPPLPELAIQVLPLSDLIVFRAPQSVAREDIIQLGEETTYGGLVQLQVIGQYSPDRLSGIVVAYLNAKEQEMLEEQVRIQ